MKSLLCFALVVCAAAVAQPTDNNDKSPSSTPPSPPVAKINETATPQPSDVNHRVERDDDQSKVTLDQSVGPSKFRENNNRAPKTDSKATNDKSR